jgi:PRTRC genetic system protein A
MNPSTGSGQAPAGYLHNTPKGLLGEPGIGYNYILARNGLFIRAENDHLEAIVPIFQLEEGRPVRGLAPMEKRVTLKHGPIPVGIWERAYNTLMEDPSSECYMAIVWVRGSYELAVPPQAATAASVAYERPRNLVVDIHSHGAIKAFFSATDNQDDQGLKISIVVGNLDKGPWYPDRIASRVCIYGYYAPVDATHLWRSGEDV